MQNKLKKEKVMKDRADEIARMCYQVNKAWCECNGDMSQVDWEDAERCKYISGVVFALNNPDATPADQHIAWMQDKIADGWVYGEVKDTVAKTHPCLVPYEKLPEFQRKKDALFRAIVNVLK